MNGILVKQDCLTGCIPERGGLAAFKAPGKKLNGGTEVFHPFSPIESRETVRRLDGFPAL